MSLDISTPTVPTTFVYNGNSFDFDARDADDADKFEKALKILQADEADLPKSGPLPEIYRKHCGMLKKFFDNCLEDGAGVKLCTEKSNVSVCYAAYEAFLLYVRKQQEDIIRAKNTFAKYSNRKQRREADRKNK